MANDSIQARLQALPPSVRQFVEGSDFEKTIQDIGSRHRLHVDKVGILEAEALSAMTGVTNFDDFTENLVDVLEIEHAAAEPLAKEVNELIFSKIRNNMKAADMPTPTPIAPSMPSAVSAAPVTGSPGAVPTAPITPPATAPTPVDIAAETILSTPTASAAPTQPQTVERPIAKTDPYREPVE